MNALPEWCSGLVHICTWAVVQRKKKRTSPFLAAFEIYLPVSVFSSQMKSPTTSPTSKAAHGPLYLPCLLLAIH